MDDIKSCLSYAPMTGVFTWIASPSKHAEVCPGQIAGYRDKSGYVQIRFQRRLYKAHRLAWWFVHGEMPPNGAHVDHINGNSSDNRIVNLRIATCSQNLANRGAQSNNRAGIKGVHLHAFSGLYHAQIAVRGRRISLGYHKTPTAAHAAYVAAAEREFGSFARGA